MGETLKIGDFGHIFFEIHRRDYYRASDGKLKYNIVKSPYDFEGAVITEVDAKWLWIEGLDKSLGEHFLVKRKNVKDFVKQTRPCV